MRLVIATLAGLAVLTSFGSAADAHPRKKKYRDCYRYERCDTYWWYGWRDLFPGYQVRNPDNFRTGSQAWWKAMDMDGRGGRRP